MDARHPFMQFVRFGIIGVISTLKDILVMNGCMMAFHMSNIPASVISFMVSLIFNYTASMRFVFTHKDGVSRWHDFTVFVISALMGLIITAVIIWISTYGLSNATSQAYVIRTNIGKIVAIIIVAIWNFIIRKTFIDSHE